MTDIENLYKCYAGDVRRFVLYLCGDEVLADEITSDTFVRRLRRRTASLVCAASFTLIPIPFVLHFVSAGWPVVEYAIIWIFAAFIWLAYFRQRPS